MKHWLFKSEPETWSWGDQLAAAQQTTAWDGVRNHQANLHLKTMAIGDRGFFYHSVKARQIVGIVEVVKAWERDPSDDTGRSREGFGMVTLRAVEALPHPVSLDRIKAEASLRDMVLVQNSRLSVQPVSAAQWKQILKLAHSLAS